MSNRPKLRNLDFQPVTYQGRRMWYLRDPWNLSERQLIVPAELAPLLLFCDGNHKVTEIHTRFSQEVGEVVPFRVVSDALSELNDACLLQNERSQAVRRERLAEYHAQPFRVPALAGLSYPEEKDQLTTLLQSFSNGESRAEPTVSWDGRGVVSPHIDYQRGGPVYARVWQRAAAAVLAADLILIFGTDHNGGPGSITLTHQSYATPYGVLPADRELVATLATAFGPDAAFADELNHLGEHSVELSAVWVHYIYHQAGMAPCPMVPVLVGSFQRFVAEGLHPSQDIRIERFLTALHSATSGRRVLAVGSVDLAHVGPAFGDNFTMDALRREQLVLADRDLIDHTLRGDAFGFYEAIATVNDRHRICGFSPLYLMLRYLGLTKGVAVDYRQCPADPDGASLVSICGLLLE